MLPRTVIVYMPKLPRIDVLVSLKGLHATPKRGLKLLRSGKRRFSGYPASVAVRNGVHAVPNGAAEAGHALMLARNPGAVTWRACGSVGIITRPVRGTERSKLVML